MAAATDIDTIVAVATAPGRGGIGIVRVSGPAVKTIIPGFLSHEPKPRHAYYCDFADVNGEIVDQGLLLYFSRPASYTGEDVLELHGHGSRVALEQIVKRVIAMGARHARPGEFTERAFLNHKIDLAQAEAVADLIDAGSAQAARSAMRSLTGEFSRTVMSVLNKVIRLRVMTEGALDFPDEDADFYTGNEGEELLLSCITDVSTILKRAQQGALLRQGINIVIAGRPNAGKSTLLNRLVGEDAAIVSDIPGTTRDLIERNIAVDGMPLHIIDTAGLRLAGNIIEQEGIRRATEAASRADLIILMLEYGQSPGAEENKILQDAGPGKPVIMLYNKIDLAGAPARIAYKNHNHTEIKISAHSGAGMELLLCQLKEYAGMHNSEDAFMARKRHLNALEEALRALQHVAQGHQQRVAGELLAVELRQAQLALSEITGEFAADDLLGEIFRNFCIGK